MLATDNSPSPVRTKGATVHGIESLRAAKRSRIRRRLRRRVALIRHLSAVAMEFVEGADPNDAVYFLKLLRDYCDKTIRSVS